MADKQMNTAMKSQIFHGLSSEWTTYIGRHIPIRKICKTMSKINKTIEYDKGVTNVSPFHHQIQFVTFQDITATRLDFTQLMQTIKWLSKMLGKLFANAW